MRILLLFGKIEGFLPRLYHLAGSHDLFNIGLGLPFLFVLLLLERKGKKCLIRRGLDQSLHCLLLVIIDLLLLKNKAKEYFIFILFVKTIRLVILVWLKIVIIIIVAELLSFLLTSC